MEKWRLGPAQKWQVLDGRVACPRHRLEVDVERCLSCPLQRRLQRRSNGEVAVIVCSFSARVVIEPLTT